MTLTVPCIGAGQIVDDTATGSTADLTAAVFDVTSLSATFEGHPVTYTVGSTPPPALVDGTYRQVTLTLTQATATSMALRPVTTARSC